MWEWFQTSSLFIFIREKIAAGCTEKSLFMYWWKQRALQYLVTKLISESLSEVSGRLPSESLLFAQSRGIILTDGWAAKLHHFAVCVPSNQSCRFSFLPVDRLAVVSTPCRFYLILHRPASGPEAGRWRAVVRLCASACVCAAATITRRSGEEGATAPTAAQISLRFSPSGQKKIGHRGVRTCVRRLYLCTSARQTPHLPIQL